MRDLLWFLAVVIAFASYPLYNLTQPAEIHEWIEVEEPSTLECDQLYDEKMMREV